MTEQDLKQNGVQHNQANFCKRIEPDWTESEWFQVWLELARHPYQFEEPDLTGEAELLTLDLSTSGSTEAGFDKNLTAQG